MKISRLPSLLEPNGSQSLSKTTIEPSADSEGWKLEQEPVESSLIWTVVAAQGAATKIGRAKSAHNRAGAPRPLWGRRLQ